MHFKASVGWCGSCRSRTHSNSTIKTAADPFLAGGLVAVACLALIVTGAWHEWSARSVDLRNAEIEMANLAKSLVQHADDTFEITEIVLDGVVAALEQNGTSPESLTRLQKFLQLRKSVGCITGLFVFDAMGHGSRRRRPKTVPGSTTATAITSGRTRVMPRGRR